MDQNDRIYKSKVIGIQHYYGNHGNTIDGNQGSGSHPDEDIKVFNKHRVSDHLYTILLSMVTTKQGASTFVAHPECANTFREIGENLFCIRFITLRIFYYQKLNLVFNEREWEGGGKV